MHNRVSKLICTSIIFVLLVLFVLSATLNVIFFRRERYRAVFMSTEEIDNSYCIEVEATHPVLFALQFKKQLYIVTDESKTTPQNVSLFAPSVHGPIEPPIVEGKKEITVSEFSRDFWFINSQIGGW